MQHRIFHPETLQPDVEVILDEQASRHVVQALRLKAGDAFTLFDGSGNDFAAILISNRKQVALAQVQHKLHTESPSQLNLHLAVGVSRGERMDFSIQKAVELGVSQITPLFTERTLVQFKNPQKQQTRLMRWRGIIRHACEQSGRSLLPALHKATGFSYFITHHTGQGILLDHHAKNGLNQLTKPQHHLTLLVGPEGGLSPQEREQARQSGFIPVRLGPRILRTETAPLAALAAVQMLWGDF